MPFLSPVFFLVEVFPFQASPRRFYRFLRLSPVRAYDIDPFPLQDAKSFLIQIPFLCASGQPYANIVPCFERVEE